MATGDALLALLLPGPRHGYDLKRAYDDWFSGLKPLAFGQVYSTLSRLQRDGLVQIAHTETGEGPERVVYEVTPSGRQQAQAWLAEPVEPGLPPAEELIRKTLSAYRLDADPAGLMARQRASHLRAIRALEPGRGAAAGSTAVGLATALLTDHARLHLDADLRWLELAADRFRTAPAPPVRVSPATAPIPQYGETTDESEIVDGDPIDADQPADQPADPTGGATAGRLAAEAPTAAASRDREAS
jgi:DNA-binding PadR family transcriptional regulator